MLTAADLDAMTRDDRWNGFGYLGERTRTTQDTTDADTRALDSANQAGMTYEDLFAWANSKDGRWYGDCMFGDPLEHRFAEKYLPVPVTT